MVIDTMYVDCDFTVDVILSLKYLYPAKNMSLFEETFLYYITNLNEVLYHRYG